VIPLASIADFARDQGRLGAGERAATQHRALEQANWVVSPFARPSRLTPDRVLVVGARSDRITPVAHAERIAAHFGAELVCLGGGHLMQLWRRDAFRAAKALWSRLGIV
jgi:predicted alpha/beta hydrolase family esterase